MRDGLASRGPICSARSSARWQYDAYLPVMATRWEIRSVRQGQRRRNRVQVVEQGEPLADFRLGVGVAAQVQPQVPQEFVVLGREEGDGQGEQLPALDQHERLGVGRGVGHRGRLAGAAAAADRRAAAGAGCRRGARGRVVRRRRGVAQTRRRQRRARRFLRIDTPTFPRSTAILRVNEH